MTTNFLSIIIVILFFFALGVAISVIIKKLKKSNKEEIFDQMLQLLNQWPEIEKNKHLKTEQFIKQTNTLKKYYLKDIGKIEKKDGYFTITFYGETRFFPSKNIFGNKKEPSYKFTNENEENEYYLHILEKFGKYMYSNFRNKKNFVV